MGKSIKVEIFCNGVFFQWFPARTMKEVLTQISKYEGVERLSDLKLSDLKLSYLVFQKSDKGPYRGVYGRYHKVCSINATGREKPKFFDPIKG